MMKTEMKLQNINIMQICATLRMNSLKFFLAFSFFWGLQLTLFAQELSEFKDYKERYPDKMAVILDHFQDVLIDLRADSVYILQEDYDRTLYLNTQAKLLSEDRVYISGFNKNKSLEAKTLLPYKKNKFKEIKVDNFYESHDMSASVFYDDFTAISFTYPSLQEGAQTVLKHSFEYTNMRLLRGFYFGSFLPVINAKLTVTVHENIKLNFALFNAENKN